MGFGVDWLKPVEQQYSQTDIDLHWSAMKIPGYQRVNIVVPIKAKCTVQKHMYYKMVQAEGYLAV